MNGRSGINNVPRLVFGLTIVLVGAIFTLDRLDVVDAGHFLAYWPVLLIAWGLARVLQGTTSQGFGIGVVVIIVGVLFLADNLDLFEVRFWDLWPLLLVLVGGMMVYRAVGGPSWRRPAAVDPTIPPHPDSFGGEVPGMEQSAPPPIPGGDPGDSISGFALLGGSTRRSTCKAFRGGDLTAVLGGCEVDLRQATPAPGGAVLETFALMGGIEVKVPQDWLVIVEGVPVLGAFEDKTSHTTADPTKQLRIRGAAIMGGVEVKN
jgi:hypothetical protein